MPTHRKRKRRLIAKASRRYGAFLLASVVVLVAAVGYLVVHFSGASSCVVEANLENSCRPLIGAAAYGNPGTPAQIANHTAPGSDPVSQFNYLQGLIGQHLDVFRDYLCPYGKPCPSSQWPLTGPEKYFATQVPGTYVDINWVPTANWSDADGSNPTVNQEITQAADSIKSIAPHKVFLSLWHETNLHTNGAPGTHCTYGGQYSAGTPAQFVAAWQYIHGVFDAQGATNVEWTMNYSSDPGRYCLIPYLWPGNSYVDWVTWDTYSRGKTWDQTSGAMYNTMQADNNATDNFESKPWGIGEFGTCQQPSTGITEQQYFQSVDQAVKAGTYPRLKMYLDYSNTSEGVGMGCLTDYLSNDSYSAPKEASVNQLFADIVGTSSPTPTPTPPPTHTPTPPPTHTPTPPPTKTPTPPVTPTPSVGGGGGSGGGGGTGTVDFGSPGSSADVSVNGQQVSTNGTLNTDYLTNGMHTVTVTQDGHTYTHDIRVNNKLSPFDTLRNILFARFVGHPMLMNIGTILVLLLPVAVALFFLRRKLVLLVPHIFKRRPVGLH